MWGSAPRKKDGWDAERATTEATAIGLKSDALKAFAIDYAKTHKG